MKILVLGYIVKGPLAGMSLHYLQYVLGLKALGHEVLFYEDSDDGYPSCFNPESNEMTIDPGYGLQYINSLFKKFNLQNSWSYYDSNSGHWYGVTKTKFLEFCKNASIVLNVSAVNPLREWWLKIPCRVFIDTDPLFTQIKHITNEHAFNIAKAHDFFFSFAENIEKSNCTIPSDGLKWQPTRQPLYLPIWKKSFLEKAGSWTTIMQWNSYKEVLFKGKSYGMKSNSFLNFLNLPVHLKDEVFELAAIGMPDVLKIKLQLEGWKIDSTAKSSKTIDDYQHYLCFSKGEWSVAKEGYVVTQSGWFSERTLNYMACGKPVVVQDTGFSNFLPTGKGILAFSNLSEAVEQLKKVNRDYKFHCLRARQIAEEYFNSTKILQRLLQNII